MDLLKGWTKHEPVHLLRLPRQTEPDHHRPERLVQANALEVEFLQEKPQHLLGLGVILLRTLQKRRTHSSKRKTSNSLAVEDQRAVQHRRGKQSRSELACPPLDTTRENTPSCYRKLYNENSPCLQHKTLRSCAQGLSTLVASI